MGPTCWRSLLSSHTAAPMGGSPPVDSEPQGILHKALLDKGQRNRTTAVRRAAESRQEPASLPAARTGSNPEDFPIPRLHGNTTDRLQTGGASSSQFPISSEEDDGTKCPWRSWTGEPLNKTQTAYKSTDLSSEHGNISPNASGFVVPLIGPTKQTKW